MLGESKTDIGKLDVEAGVTVRAIDACTAKSQAANPGASAASGQRSWDLF